MLTNQQKTAALLWEAYRKGVGCKATNGDVFPSWEELVQDQERPLVVQGFLAVAEAAENRLREAEDDIARLRHALKRIVGFAPGENPGEAELAAFKRAILGAPAPSESYREVALLGVETLRVTAPKGGNHG